MLARDRRPAGAAQESRYCAHAGFQKERSLHSHTRTHAELTPRLSSATLLRNSLRLHWDATAPACGEHYRQATPGYQTSYYDMEPEGSLCLQIPKVASSLILD